METVHAENLLRSFVLILLWATRLLMQSLKKSENAAE